MKKLSYFFTLILIAFFTLAGCDQDKPKEEIAQTNQKVTSESTELQISHAQGFNVEFRNHYKVVTVSQPWKNANKNLQYLLVDRGFEAPEGYKDAQVIEIPLERIASTSTTHIPLLEMLDVHHKLVGFSNTDFISSPAVRELINKGKVKNFGQDGSTNLEVLAELEPEILMTYGSSSTVSLHNKINMMGVPVVINSDYLETTSLGRAEWIKFASLFFNKEKEADSIFNAVKKKYTDLQQLIPKNTKQPQVYSGIVYGDIWYVPGGKSWAAEMLQHAGADYLWKESQSQGSEELSFERVYEKAYNADFWIGAASFGSLEEIKKADVRYSNFKAFKTGNVYTYNARIGEKGGNEYMESGYARPDIILADLIKILYPELLPDHNLYYYQKLPAKKG